MSGKNPRVVHLPFWSAICPHPVVRRHVLMWWSGKISDFSLSLSLSLSLPSLSLPLYLSLSSLTNRHKQKRFSQNKRRWTDLQNFPSIVLIFSPGLYYDLSSLGIFTQVFCVNFENHNSWDKKNLRQGFLAMIVMCKCAKFHVHVDTVKLGYYVHGLVCSLGYNVLSVDHGHRQSENMYSATATKSKIFAPFF